MTNKFVIFFNTDTKPVIVLAKTDYHKNIPYPEEFGEICGRAGGGKWKINNNTLTLYDLSGDFGKYDKELAKEAFNNNAVYYFDDLMSDFVELTNIITE